ncbi:hypothetical protein N480_03445 [Pseudoalteromonas luteoviolacea S2607]|uniref:alpha/beta hydrolase n=1 Tax=Pseudoalteromonas luteoviolacea TaxID=43657 RepID=UPI0007B0BE98|nr:alpha/beta fold hydrolase [Pseudoalteromonas luteoviolacea]KZN30011.1 hypothetical protein N480_03445 [Pseudoalteromonas luteoviolacea S2607]
MCKKYICLFVVLLISGCSFSGVFFPIDERPDDSIEGIVETTQLTSSDGNTINHFLFKPPHKPKATIFVFQGSGSKVVNWHKVIKPLIENGYQVFMMEYRGFGKSEGEASHSLVAQDASRALTYLSDRLDVKGLPILVLGQSYGGQLAIYVTHKHPDLVDGLITEGTFTSFSDEAAYSSPLLAKPFVRAIFSEPYVSEELIADLQKPLLIVHSSQDKVVPFSMAKTLYARARSDKKLWEVKGKHVAAMIDYPQEYVDRINELLQRSQNDDIES